jgi:hypothetical protein
MKMRRWTQNLADQNRRDPIVHKVRKELAKHLDHETVHKITSQLTDDLKGKLAPIWKHGRGSTWFYADKANLDKDNPLGNVSYEWSLFKKQSSIGTSFDYDNNEGEFTLSIRIPMFGIYVSVDAPEAIRKKLGYRDGRQLGFSIHNGTVWFKLWCDPHAWSKAPFSRADSHLRQPNFHYVDFILGKEKHRSIVMERQSGDLNLDNGYQVYCELEVHEVTRSRWPFPKRYSRVMINIPEGIPIPDDEEEDEAVYSFSTTANTINDGAYKLIEHIKRKRDE